MFRRLALEAVLLPWTVLGLALDRLPDPYAQIPAYVLNPLLLIADLEGITDGTA